MKEITLDLSSSMMLIARTVFPKARITNDRFHVQKVYYDAIDDLRVSLRWMARAKYILTKHESKWTRAQRWKADIIFEFYPELKRAYELAMELTNIFNGNAPRMWQESNWQDGSMKLKSWRGMHSRLSLTLL